MKILEKILLFFQGAEKVGEDYYGNSYYLLKTKDAFGRRLRYVKYEKKKNISSIPPLYNAWLRYSLDDFNDIEKLNAKNPNFIKFHQPNLTGIDGCYYPENHALSGRKQKDDVIYHSWLES